MQETKRQLILIVHNIRSSHNVGSLLRTTEGLGIQRVYLTGYTPFPKMEHDPRLPHEAEKLQQQIHKTALGAEDSQDWVHEVNVFTVLERLKQKGYTIGALEQDSHAKSLPKYTVPEKLALIVGREVEGIEPEILKSCDVILEIPMSGQKESFNVAQATAMALYHIRFQK